MKSPLTRLSMPNSHKRRVNDVLRGVCYPSGMTSINVEFERSYARPGDLPAAGLPEVAFIGRSNVGKSSLINHLCEKKDLSRVSATPGRTQLINRFKFGTSFYLVDLPGYGYAKHAREKRDELEELIYQYLIQRKPVLIVMIIDANIGPTDLDNEMRDFLDTEGMHYVMIANKVDKLSGNEQRQLVKDLQQVQSTPIIFHSAKKKQGRGEILTAIQEALRTK